MKKNHFLFVLICCIFFSKVNAQLGMFSLSGAVPVSQNTLGKTIAGGGMQISLYAPEIVIIGRQGRCGDSIDQELKHAPLSVCIGVDGMVSFMGHDKFKSVPVINPEPGYATVKFQNSMYALNLSARFTSTCFNGKILPYADLFAGYRLFSSDMTITPEDDNNKETNSTLSKVSGINVGVGAGLMIALTERQDVMLNVGLAWSHSEAPGKFVDVSRIERSGGSLIYYSRPAVQDFMILKVGVTGLFSYSHHDDSYETNGNGTHHSGSYHGHGHSGSCGHGSSHISLIAK